MEVKTLDTELKVCDMTIMEMETFYPISWEDWEILFTRISLINPRSHVFNNITREDIDKIESYKGSSLPEEIRQLVKRKVSGAM